MSKRVLAATIILVVVQFVVNAQNDSLYLKNRFYHQQLGLYEIYRTTHSDVVMLGNSITFGADWNELLGRTSVVNRGIVSDNTFGILSRMEEGLPVPAPEKKDPPAVMLPEQQQKYGCVALLLVSFYNFLSASTAWTNLESMAMAAS